MRCSMCAISLRSVALRRGGDMELIVAIIQREDAERLTDALTEKGYKFTRIGTTSGLSRISNVTLLV
nr:hypothetical protein [Anaerolineae bacterium]